MTTITDMLYDNLLSAGDPSTPAAKEIYHKDDKLWDEIRPVIGSEMVEKLRNSQNAIVFQTNLDWFREGVRVGLSLMMEVF